MGFAAKGSITRRALLATGAAGLLIGAGAGRAQAATDPARDIIIPWYRLILELVRHTPTYSPPVASRAFAWLGITCHEAMAATRPGLQPLASQLRGVGAGPPADHACDPGAVLQGAMALAVPHFFGNTGPTGQRAMAAMDRRIHAAATDGLSAETATASITLGQAIARHVIAASASDGGDPVLNMGFPQDWPRRDAPDAWVPTSGIALQQAPLLPDWHKNRPFALPPGEFCALPVPPPYSDDPASEFQREMREVYEVSKALTEEQKIIARFWSDDPMLSPTPPGHWVWILLDIAERDALPADRLAEGLALLGIAIADGFIACWQQKYHHDYIRPVTAIRRAVDPAWEPLLITPPFPEYPSGHSTQSGAAAAVLIHLFGEDFAFEDATHVDDGLPVRSFTGFREAASEAAISRLYGGIHFRTAIEQGLDQGYCVGAHVTALRTRA
ncbi:vanadium-dependent haloperoxidase [Szabonella alba]|uniref:Vanadium-dependent haloperoxidase n=1 Tax=Szabonella alba TaxID=2804194 RepID=A0A8K0VAM1_9RHOB|nr:vanadium-dependent haloperoxidase [Szabonella alba]MBL4916693.1 vanadium-dependent haloperoxidase [Szabonella alba]